MKYYLLTALWFLSISIVCAQYMPGGSEAEHFDFGDTQATPGYFGAVDVKAPDLLGHTGIEIGVRFGSYLSKNFSLGVGIYSLFTKNVEFEYPGASQPLHLRLSYGGLDADYRLRISEKFDLSWNLFTGPAEISHSSNSNIDLGTINNKWYFFLVPSQTINYYFSKTMGLQLSVGYRAFLGGDYLNFSAKKLNGTVFALSIISYIYD